MELKGNKKVEGFVLPDLKAYYKTAEVNYQGVALNQGQINETKQR